MGLAGNCVCALSSLLLLKKRVYIVIYMAIQNTKNIEVGNNYYAHTHFLTYSLLRYCILGIATTKNLLRIFALFAGQLLRNDMLKMNNRRYMQSIINIKRS